VRFVGWSRNLFLITVLFVLWLAVVMAAVFSSPWWDFVFFGWSFSYWFSAQGCLIAFGLIVWAYAAISDRLEAAGTADA